MYVVLQVTDGGVRVIDVKADDDLQDSPLRGHIHAVSDRIRSDRPCSGIVHVLDGTVMVACAGWTPGSASHAMEFGGDVKIEADRETCTAAGQCASVAAALFDQDEDGVVVLLKVEPSEAEEALARRAASLCPARAITIIED